MNATGNLPQAVGIADAYTFCAAGDAMPTTADILLKPREAAAALGVSYPTLKQWILAGTLHTIKTPGGHHRIPESSLKPLMKSRPAGNPKASRDRFRAVIGRNQLVGQIVELKISGLLAKVVLEIGDQRITSIITSDAAREMQLRKGQTAAALIKATEVMIVRV
jgi:molybdopterin-binding protein